MKTILAVLLAVVVLAPAGWADEQRHYLYRTPGGTIHCYITTLDGDQDYAPGSWTGFAQCSTWALTTRNGRRAEVGVAEKDRSYTLDRKKYGIVNMRGGTTLRADRTYVFKYPWRTGRKMFWVTVRRTATMESIHVRNPEGHGFLIRVVSGRTKLVRF